MMRRLIPLFLCLLLLSGCTPHDPLADMAQPAADEQLTVPVPVAEQTSAQAQAVTLWFRFGDEPLLAPESRTIVTSPTAPFEMTLLQALIGGPSAGMLELNSLFPPGTRVVSTYRQGRLLFVTLSRQIMNAYADEPEFWQSSPQWASEVPLRRQLAMQAIAATVSENCEVDQVVVLVEQGAQPTDSMRLRQSYYRTGADTSALAAPLTREEDLLLTPQTTLDIILRCWSERNWERLYRYVASTDPAQSAARPGVADFTAQMDRLPLLTDYAFEGGSVSYDGGSAAFTADLTLMASGQEYTAGSSVIRLTRERGIWRIGLSQLTTREVTAP